MNQIEQAVDVNVPLKAAYAQCLRFSDYPRFMERVESVRAVDEKHLRWRALRQGKKVEWSSVITERDPECSIAWQDVDDPRQTSTLSFIPLGPEKTRIRAVLALADGEEDFEEGGEQTESRLAGDLERLKKLLESKGHDWNEWPSTHDAQASPARAIHVDGDSISDSQYRQEKSLDSASQGRYGSMSQDTPDSGHRSDTAAKSIQGLLRGWDQPLSIVRKMSGEMDQLFERLIGRQMAGKWGRGMPGRWTPTVEVAQRVQEFVISVDLPGVAKQDVHIEVHGSNLTIEGERREPDEQKSLPGYRRTERHYGRFYRQLPLPDNVETEKIRATLLNGVLEIRMPLPPGMGEQGRRVDIEDLS